MIEIIKEDYKVIVPKELDFDIVENSNLANHRSANPHGDWVGIAAVLNMFEPDDGYQVIEVGTAHGHFLRTFYEYLENRYGGGMIRAFGVDSKLHGYCPCEFAGNMTFVDGNSTDPQTLNKFGDKCFEFVFIDGCHCENHAYMDAVNWSKKVSIGGYLGFHDTSPTFQGGTEQPKTDGCSEDTRIGVVKGIERWNPEANGFQFVLQEYHTNIGHGGVTIYQRVK